MQPTLHSVILWHRQTAAEALTLAESALKLVAASNGVRRLIGLSLVTWPCRSQGIHESALRTLNRLCQDADIRFDVLVADDPGAQFEGCRGLLRCFQFRVDPPCDYLLIFDEPITRWRARRLLKLVDDCAEEECIMVTVRKVGLDRCIHYAIVDTSAVLSPCLPSLAADFPYAGGLLDSGDGALYKGRRMFPFRFLSFPLSTDFDDLIADMERVSRRNKWKVESRGTSPLT